MTETKKRMFDYCLTDDCKVCEIKKSCCKEAWDRYNKVGTVV